MLIWDLSLSGFELGFPVTHNWTRSTVVGTMFSYYLIAELDNGAGTIFRLGSPDGPEAMSGVN